MSYGHPYGPPPPDQSKKFLNMSGGVLALAIAAIVLIPVLCCIGCLFTGVIGSLTGNPVPTPTP